MLFNFAAAGAGVRRDGEALAAYEQYLSELPDAANRDFTEERIAFLREQLAREAELREAAMRGAHAPLLPRPDPHPELPLDEDEPQSETLQSDTLQSETLQSETLQSETLPSGEPRVAVLEVEEIPIPAPEIPRAVIDPAAGGDRDSGEDLVEQWWFWTIVGVAVVGTGVGIGAAVAAASDGGQVGGATPVTGDFGPGGIVVALEAF